MFLFDIASNDVLQTYIKDKKFYIINSCLSPYKAFYYDISTYVNKILHCEIIKTAGDVSSFKINGNLLTGVGTASAWSLPAQSLFGQDTFSVSLTIGTLWNIKVHDQSLNMLHWWRGDGSTNYIWQDLVGSAHGAVSSSFTTRIIP
jgi:hypothetical protein